jgi:hypothetical protein
MYIFEPVDMAPIVEVAEYVVQIYVISIETDICLSNNKDR